MTWAEREALRDRISAIDHEAQAPNVAPAVANLLLAQAILTSCLVNLAHIEASEADAATLRAQGDTLLASVSPVEWLRDQSRLAWACWWAFERGTSSPTAADTELASKLIVFLDGQRT